MDFADMITEKIVKTALIWSPSLRRYKDALDALCESGVNLDDYTAVRRKMNELGVDERTQTDILRRL